MKNNNDILSTDTIGIKHSHQSRQTGRIRSRRRAIDREVAEHSAHDRLSPRAKTHIDSANERAPVWNEGEEAGRRGVESIVRFRQAGLPKPYQHLKKSKVMINRLTTGSGSAENV